MTAPEREIRLYLDNDQGGAEITAPLLSALADAGYLVVTQPDEADEVVPVANISDAVIALDKRLGRTRVAPFREQRLIDTGATVTSVAISAGDAPMVIVGGNDGVIRTWDLNGPGARELRGHAGAVWSVATSVFTPGRLFSGGQDGTVRAWPLFGEGGGSTLYQHDDSVNAVTVGVGGEVVSGGDDQLVLTWRNNTTERLTGNTTYVTGVALLNTGSVISTSRDGTVLRWDSAGGHTELPDDSGPVQLASDGGFFVTGRKVVRLWSGFEPTASLDISSDVTGLAVEVIDGVIVVVIGGADGLVRVWQPGTGGMTVLHGHTAPVAGVALGAVDNRPVIVSGDEAGTVRVWSSPLADQVDWAPDAPATEDWLRRRPLAAMIAQHLRRVDESFLVHVDGPWGSGKSTVLGFLGDELADDFTTVRFDAWREAGVGPAWWALLTALRTAVRSQYGFFGRLKLRMTESIARLFRVGAPVVLALTVLLGIGVGIWLLFATNLQSIGNVVQSALGAIASVGTVWAGALVASRFLLWDSARGARLFEQSNTNPMLEVNRHFAWLNRKARNPVVFLVDDLDRCQESAVVELLDTIQTLVRDTGPHFIICADGAWIRASYEHAFERFASAVAEPGRPLGYLFLDKFFQLRVPIPAIDVVRRQEYLRRLLRTGIAAPNLAEENLVRAEIERSTTEAQVVAALQSTSPEVRSRVAEVALRRMMTPEAVVATEHSLQRYAPLLPANPRAMKRFLNTYSAMRAVRTLEGNPVRVDVLAVWTILETRWPGVADHLRERPEDVEMVGSAEVKGVPEGLRGVFGDRELVGLVKGRLGVEEIRSCCGI
ncbi:P-loop NTPase fold protein [Actinokineospora inagensis]|uniref:P-loop NTPase fold protein n=1 Tax=Actinokineospora inagensis TaxID=103730 RepID=UPI00040DE2A4|nr:P-loop NTPase fold protein [Actinokineospora inagensis]